MTHDSESTAPRPLWRPDPDTVAGSAYGRFARFVDDRHRIGLEDALDHARLWRWSTENIEDYWQAVWDFFGVRSHTPWTRVLGEQRMPGAQWFSGATLNYAEHVLTNDHSDADALICIREDGTRETVTWDQLRRRVASVAAALRAAGVEAGDRVVGYLPPGQHAAIGLLAASSIGAVWSQCAQDFAAPAVIDRFAQLEPTVLIAADGYAYNGTIYDRRPDVDRVRDGLPTLTHTILVDHLGPAAFAEAAPGTAPEVTDPTRVPDPTRAPDPSRRPATSRWDDVVAHEAELSFTPVPFDHPLWVLFSSGTTGRPKGIVHGHGGIVLSLLPMYGLHMDVQDGDRLFWYASTNWVMWNVVVSALLTGASTVIYDGSPVFPDARRLWRIAAEEQVTCLGISPGHLLASERAGLRPGSEFDLSRLRTIGSTGSPLPSGCYHWVHDQVGSDIQLSSITGGTDTVVAFACTTPATPVWPGELSARALGVAMESWSPDGEPQVDEVGELVLTRPLPSMPVSFWNDPDGSRYRDAYFATFPGVWRHGDWVTVTDRGTVLMHGRSDSTLNRNGVRLGSAEIYSAVDRLAQITDSVVVGVDEPDGAYWMPLFVTLAPGVVLDDALSELVRDEIRRHASPRHVPDEIIVMESLPHTRTGKKIEVPLKRILQGAEPAAVVSADALDDPDALAAFVALAERRRSAR